LRAEQASGTLQTGDSGWHVNGRSSAKNRPPRVWAILGCGAFALEHRRLSQHGFDFAVSSPRRSPRARQQR